MCGIKHEPKTEIQRLMRIDLNIIVGHLTRRTGLTSRTHRDVGYTQDG